MAVCRLAVEFEAVFFRHGGTQGRFGKFARPGISRTLPCRRVSVSSRDHMVARTGGIGNDQPVRGGSSCVGLLWKQHRRNFRTSAVVREVELGVTRADVSLPLSPAVRYLVDSNDIDPSVIAATGPNQRLLKGDVLKYLESVKAGRIQPAKLDPKPVKPVKATPPPVQPVSGETSYTDIPLDGMRRTIAQRLTLSKATIPYCYASAQCNMNSLLELRRKLKDQGVATTVNDFLVKAAAVTLERLPQCNAIWADGSVYQLPSIDISVAVATEGGLITPIVRDANRCSIEGISATIKELAGRAREGKLKPHEFEGGGFSVSYLGKHGVTEFSAIINPPQAAILAVGALQAGPDETGTVKRYINATLSCDARVLDYELSCKWLEQFRDIIEYPTSHGLL